MIRNKAISRLKPIIIVVLIVNAPLIPFVTNIIVVININEYCMENV